MDTVGTPITFDIVAHEAGEIERLRARERPAPDSAVPDRQRATVASPRRRLGSATERIRHLDADNQRFRAMLAEALGGRRPLER
ncbi:hypothetical protein [Pseudonocardia sp. MH-G8]|uniref:hypothetical protein n=1 Tax=Pseudonocardia sp. MH-G8 TaxID=1854588 RepID=UPI000BA0FA24|nr:hypothetical protein [Pseudonocardia sp. MH-G8]OZM77824.1 hypothetical protein CFP66_34255 [Pseudonocardia sp. MH-G8]